MEIERKFLIGAFPEDFPGCPEPAGSVYMEQGYIALTPVVRVRSERSGDAERYVLCVKGRGGLSRAEIETDVPREFFLRAAAFIGGNLIKKEQRRYALGGGLVLECNLVDAGSPTEFMYAEVEFPSEAEAVAFVPPPYLGREVTYDEGFSIKQYWARTRGK